MLPGEDQGGTGRLWAVCLSARERGEAEERQELLVSLWEKARPDQAEAPKLCGIYPGPTQQPMS